jgi:RNA chaperone Hfq
MAEDPRGPRIRFTPVPVAQDAVVRVAGLGRGGLAEAEGGRAEPARPRRAGPGRTQHQDALLNGWRHAGATLEVRCLGGEVVRGRLTHFDTYSLVLDTPDGPTLLFKHAVVTIRAARSR